MKIQFADKTYIDVSKSTNSDTIFICIASNDLTNKSMIITSVELTIEQIKTLFQDIS
jgi:hypothetical protein